MIDDYFDALEAAAEARTGMAGKVFDTLRRDSTGGLIRANYALLNSPVPDEIPQDRFTQPVSMGVPVSFECRARVVGIDPRSVRWMSSRLLELVGTSLTISGRQPALIGLADAGEIKEDPSVKPFLYICDISFAWRSHPA